MAGARAADGALRAGDASRGGGGPGRIAAPARGRGGGDPAAGVSAHGAGGGAFSQRGHGAFWALHVHVPRAGRYVLDGGVGEQKPAQVHLMVYVNPRGGAVWEGLARGGAARAGAALDGGHAGMHAVACGL
eukprot:9491476-Pyramimonas_sp.AAC.1